jgi:hypothetical protein
LQNKNPGDSFQAHDPDIDSDIEDFLQQAKTWRVNPAEESQSSDSPRDQSWSSDAIESAMSCSRETSPLLSPQPSWRAQSKLAKEAPNQALLYLRGLSNLHDSSTDEETSKQQASNVKIRNVVAHQDTETGWSKLNDDDYNGQGEQRHLPTLKGLKLKKNGLVKDAYGRTVGILVEGDGAALIGYRIGDNGEVLNDRSKVVGRCEEADPSILKGLKVGEAGLVKNSGGRTVGKLVFGDAEKLLGYTIGELGEVVNGNGAFAGFCELVSPMMEGVGCDGFIDAEAHVLQPAKSFILEPQELKAFVADRKNVAAECGLDLGNTALDRSSQESLVVSGCLGHGSLGIVEEVHRPTFPSFVRKRVQIPRYQRQKRLRIIQEEARVLEDLCHPHIVQILGSYDDFTYGTKHFYCLLMSPVGEGDLQTFMDEVGTLGPTTTQIRWLLDWIPCLTSALAYMHGQGVRHQDIKPSNIIHRGSRIFFTDFSSSSRFSIGQTTSTENPARISAMYAAPEAMNHMQADGTLNRLGRGTDIFSLGCVFSEMWTVATRTPIHKFHDFLLETSQDADQLHGNSEVVCPGTLIYSRVTERMALWFEQYLNARLVFGRVIAPMICLQREERTDAHGLMHNLKELDEIFRESKNHEYLWSACHCHRLGGGIENLSSGGLTMGICV